MKEFIMVEDETKGYSQGRNPGYRSEIVKYVRKEGKRKKEGRDEEV